MNTQTFRKIKSLIYSFLIGTFLVIVFLNWFSPAVYHQRIGKWARKLGFYDYAIKHYSYSLHQRHNASAFNSRGVTYYHINEFERALIDYNRAIEIDPQFALAIKNRALALLAMNKGEQAKKDYDLACKYGRCENFEIKCGLLKERCEKIECISFETAVDVGLCSSK